MSTIVSSLIKTVMCELGLKQAELANALGVSLDRVKSLTSGKVKKLAPEESKALIQKLHVRGDWLATGEGPVLQPEKERLLHRRLGDLNQATQKADRIGLTQEQKATLQEILFYVEVNDVAALNELVVVLSGPERSLLQGFRMCAENDQETIRQLAQRLASSGGKTK